MEHPPETHRSSRRRLLLNSAACLALIDEIIGVAAGSVETPAGRILTAVGVACVPALVEIPRRLERRRSREILDIADVPLACDAEPQVAVQQPEASLTEILPVIDEAPISDI